MKNKGFTLAELVGVLVILAALILMAIPTVTKNIKEATENAYNEQLESIKLSLQLWLNDNPKPNNGESITITLSQLKYAGLVEMDMINPKTEKLFPNDMELVITNNKGIIEYTVNENGNNKENYENIPSLKLNGNVLEYIEVGNDFIDEGVLAKGRGGNELNYTTDGNLDTNTKGTYTIKYSAFDNGYTNTIYRTVIVRDTTNPIITIPVETLVLSLSEVNKYDFKSDVTVTDNSNEEVRLIVNKDFEGIAGTYSVKYTAIDTSGNETIVYRKVIVE